MHGANADQLDALALELSSVSERMNSRAGQLTRDIHSSPWSGRGADRFRVQWDGEYRRSLVAAAAFLAEAGEVLRTNAREQRSASSAAGGVLAPITPLPNVASGGSPEVDRSWWELWLDGELNEMLWGMYDAITIFLDLLELLPMEIFSSVFGIIMGFITGPINIWFGMEDLLAFQYGGWLGAIETYGDYLQVVSGGLAIAGAWLLIPPASPIGATVLLAAAITGLVSAGIHYGVEYRETIGEWFGDASTWTADRWRAGTELAADAWDSASGRAADAWDAGTEWAGDAWNSTTDVAGDGWDRATGLVGGAWDRLTDR